MPDAGNGVGEQGRPTTPDAIADGINGLLHPARGKPADRKTPTPSPDETEEGETRADAEITNDEDVEVVADAETQDEQPEEIDPETPEPEAEDEPTIGADPLRAVKHKVPGMDQEVDYDEVLSLASKGGDYTRKTQRAAEVTKAAEASQAKYLERLGTYDASLKQVEDALKVMMPAEPDWDAVRRDTPDEYPALYTDWGRYKDRLAAVAEERAKVAKAAEDEWGTQRGQRYRDEVEKLLANVPEWKDEAKRDVELGEMHGTVKAYGFTDDEAKGIVDHRVLLLLRDANRYRKLMAKTAKTKETVQKVGPGPVKVARPSSTLPIKSRVSKAQEAASRLAKSGDVHDAAEAFFQATQARRKAGSRS